MESGAVIKKTGLLLFIVIVIGCFYLFDGQQYLQFKFLKLHLTHYQLTYQSEPIKVIIYFLGAYIFLTGLSIPGSIVLTVLAGAIFGTATGVLLVTFAGTVGASTAFLISRFCFAST